MNSKRAPDDDRWIEDLIEEAKAEQSHSPMDVGALLKESDRLATYGARQASQGLRPWYPWWCLEAFIA